MPFKLTSHDAVRSLKAGLLLILIIFISIQSFAEEQSTESVETTEQPVLDKPIINVEPEKISQFDSTRTRLESLMTSELRKEILLVQLLNELTNSDENDDELLKARIEEQITQLTEEISTIKSEFDRTLTGGIDQEKLKADVEATYNWRTDLEEVMRPIFRSLKGVTEKPREIERLRSNINFLKRNLELSQSALNFITQLDNASASEIFSLRIQQAKISWAHRIESLNEELNIVEFQLDTRLDESSNFFNNFGDTLKDFFSGRGLSILLAGLAFWAVWFFFRMVRQGYRYFISKKKIIIKSGLTSRIFYYAYQILASIIAMTAMLLVFYVKGDWIMLGFSMLVIATIIFSIKNYFPKFIVEAKLLLNVGPVREGERIFYQGIPWKVDKIRVYTELFNPLLSGGRVRVQLKELVDMNSRGYDDCEVWFPCREGDMLLMPEGRLVKVELQTPDFVKLNYTGGATTTVRTNDFLALSFTNLSEESFRVSSYFGVDYTLQKKATSRIPSIFREEIQEFIESQNYGKYLKVLRVEFHQASESALTYKVISDFHGIAARHHNIISRALQIAAVDVCNKHGWSIPFKQITIHNAATSIEAA